MLLHHSMQFKPARWKQLRGQLDRGRRQTASIPEADGPRPERDVDARHYRENRDRFHQHLHAETLFMVGSAPVFRDTASRFLDIQPAHERADGHYCTEFHSGDGVLGNAREIHITYHPEW